MISTLQALFWFLAAYPVGSWHSPGRRRSPLHSPRPKSFSHWTSAFLQKTARTLQMNSDWFPKFSDYFLTTFRWNFPLFSDQSWQKFLLWVTEYCQRRINTHRSLWILIINWNHLLFSAAALIIQLIDWSWWQHRVKNSNTQSKYGDIIHYHVDKSQNFY